MVANIWQKGWQLVCLREGLELVDKRQSLDQVKLGYGDWKNSKLMK
jgi:hypothetical protein